MHNTFEEVISVYTYIKIQFIRSTLDVIRRLSKKALSIQNTKRKTTCWFTIFHSNETGKGAE